MKEPAQHDFATDTHVAQLFIAAASSDPRVDIVHLYGDTYRWLHFYDEHGRGTKPGNERTDFHRWAGRVVTHAVPRTPIRAPLEEITIIGRVTARKAVR